LLTLAFDTATPWGRFALADEGRLLQYRPLNVMGSYADALLVVVQEILAENGRKTEELGGLGVTVGPGSFTGLRIGVATAKGLAYGLNIPLVGVGSLEAMAASLLEDHPGVDFAVPCLDARRREVFSAIYRRKGHWVEEIVPPRPLPADDWWNEILKTLPDPEVAVYGGDGTTILLGQGDDLRPELLGTGEPRTRPWTAAHPATARTLACAMGLAPEQLPATHPFLLVPDYLRRSDAELNKNLDLTPQTPSEDVSIHRSSRPSS
jgi:tRNA threonylcarbamoyladenosine biosynthesis protein TsaB